MLLDYEKVINIFTLFRASRVSSAIVFDVYIAWYCKAWILEICYSFLAQAPGLKENSNKLVEVCINVYHTISSELLPTPAKSHYTFNLRDLSKVFQGMLMFDSSKLQVG